MIPDRVNINGRFINSINRLPIMAVGVPMIAVGVPMMVVGVPMIAVDYINSGGRCY